MSCFQLSTGPVSRGRFVHGRVVHRAMCHGGALSGIGSNNMKLFGTLWFRKVVCKSSNRRPLLLIMRPAELSHRYTYMLPTTLYICVFKFTLFSRLLHLFHRLAYEWCTYPHESASLYNDFDSCLLSALDFKGTASRYFQPPFFFHQTSAPGPPFHTPKGFANNFEITEIFKFEVDSAVSVTLLSQKSFLRQPLFFIFCLKVVE